MMRLLRRLQYLLRLGGETDALAEELEFHRSMKKKELEKGGYSGSEAESAVRREMGNETGAREESRGVWLPAWLESLWADCGYALRSLRKQPGFAVVAIGTLAAAIGLNSSVFTVYSALGDAAVGGTGSQADFGGLDAANAGARGSGDAIQAVTAMAKRIDPRIYVDGHPLTEQLEQHLSAARSASALAAMLGALALSLASVGMFGVFAYIVRQRTKEIGIRMALGAGSAEVLKLVFRSSSGPVIVGFVVGILASFGVARLMQKMLLGLSSYDPVSYVGVSAVLLVSAAACWLPARRQCAWNL